MSADVVGQEQMLNSLQQLEERKALMPKLCPSWCIGQHVQAIEEGCGVEESRIYNSSDTRPSRTI